MFNQSTVFTLDDWRSNVTYYVSQNAEYVDAWEIWNEPSHPIHPLLNLGILDSNPAHEENMALIVDFYVSMAQIAHQTIRQYDPTAKILLLGGVHLWAGGGDDPALNLDRNFSSQAAAKGVFQYGDAISIHAYPWSSQATTASWNGYSESLAFYRGLFPSDKSLEVWITETGQSTTDSGEDGQVKYLVEAFDYFKGKVSMLFWYSLLDNPHLGEKDFGLIEDGLTPRAAYHALQNATH